MLIRLFVISIKCPEYSQDSKNLGLVSNISYALSIQKQKFNSSVSLSYVNINTAGKNILNTGPSMTMTKEWKNSRLRTSINHNSQIRIVNRQNDGYMSNSGATLTLNQKKQSISFSMNYLYNQYKVQSDGVNFKNFSEYRSTISYGIRF